MHIANVLCHTHIVVLGKRSWNLHVPASASYAKIHALMGGWHFAEKLL